MGEALAAAAIKVQGCRAEVLAALAPLSSGKAKAAVLNEALARRRGKVQGGRAEALGGLAAQLSGKAKSAVLDEALAAARAIEDAATRLKTLLRMLVEANRKTCLREIRQCLVSIVDAQFAQGASYNFIDPEVLRWTIVGPDTLAALARHIVEMGHRWRWL